MYDDATKDKNGVNSSNSYNGYNYTNYNYSDDKTYTGDLDGQSVYGYGSGNQGYGSYHYDNSGYTEETVSQVAPKKKNVAGKVVVIALITLMMLVGLGAGAFYVLKGGKKGTEVASSQEADSEASAGATQDAQAQGKVATTVTGEVRATVTDVTQVVEEVMPAMVIIHNNYVEQVRYFGHSETEEGTASGSGIIVGQNDSELLVATNYHVVKDADSLDVIFFDGESQYKAEIKGTKPEMDLAVIAIELSDIPADTMSQIKVATLGDSDSLKLGEPAIAIGNALGYGQSVTTGVISALNRKIDMQVGEETAAGEEEEEEPTQSFIQTDAAINPGNSGGALLNIQGEVIGINSSKSGGDIIEGIGYAIPISRAKPEIEKLMNEKTKKKVSEDNKGYIGIKGRTVPEDAVQVFGYPQGVYIFEVTPGGGAEAAGLRKGDVIIGFEGTEVDSMDDLQEALKYCAAGDTVTVKIMRSNGSEYDSEPMELQVVLAKDS
ncbi:MAG: trypsin-like peptidase domain-containing protein, partial [Butyrivibrio sp.]|nr:trypsin-like peptidase domain-containing protein [Butyrivibrio sp.]